MTMRVLPSPDCYIGSGILNQIPDILKADRVKKVMVITDAGIVKAGIYAKLKEFLEKAGVQIQLCDCVMSDPALTLVRTVVAEARQSGVDAVIGLGGGSSIDTAKVASALITNKKDVKDYLNGAPLEADALPLIAIPTTAGTGSETTNIAILSDEEAQLKKAIVSVKIIPHYAFLDAELTLGLPPAITATTGMDAFCHATESFTSVNANEHSEVLSLAAARLINDNIVGAFKNGADKNAREKMLLGSYLAGVAFANAGVTAVHAFAYPLGGMFHVAHGLSNSLMLLPIFRFNRDGNPQRFDQLGRELSKDGKGNADTLVQRIEELLQILRLPRNLAAIGIPQTALDAMAAGALESTRLLRNNPKAITLADAKAIYREAYSR